MHLLLLGPETCCDEVTARFDCWSVARPVGAWVEKHAYEERGFAVFSESGRGGDLLHTILPARESPEYIYWSPDPRSRCGVTAQRFSWEQLDLLIALWAASDVAVAEGFESGAEAGGEPTYHLGPRGDVWGWNIGEEPLRWRTSRVDGGKSPALALAFAYRGAAAVTLCAGDRELGTVSLSGNDAGFSKLPGGNLWMTASEVRRRKHKKPWSHRCLLVFLDVPLGVRGRRILITARSEGDESTGLRVLSYGDTWRHLRAQALSRAR